MRQIPVIIELICHYGETGCLLHVEVRAGYEVASGEEMLHLLADAHLGIDHFLEVNGVSDLRCVKSGVSQVSH